MALRSEDQALSRTTAAIQRGIDEGAHVGAQLHARRRGDVVADLAMGIARPGVPMTTASLVPWFSCTKVITATAVLQQWERGALKLDDRAAQHVPEFAANGKEAVTIRHLLTHTAGIPKATGTLEEVCAAPLEPDWIPGRRAAYHPQGAFLVLGEIVRRLDGRAFDAYVSEEIFEPLDMADSWLALTPERFAAYGDRLAVMHLTTDPRRPLHRQPHEWPSEYATVHAARSALGPVAELVNLFEALAADGGDVLLAQTKAAMCARHRVGLLDETFGQIIDWGLGVMVNSWHYRKRPASYGYGDHAGWRAFGHGGAESGLAWADPENDLVAAVVCNGMPGEARNHRRTQRIVNALYKDLGLDAAFSGQ
jgi:CubicO group peptidase (beta-lactamase class C family)